MSWLSDNSSSSSITYRGPLYYQTHQAFKTLHVKKSDSQRPLEHLLEKEVKLKEEKSKPSVSMPKEKILFDPKDLVL